MIYLTLFMSKIRLPSLKNCWDVISYTPKGRRRRLGGLSKQRHTLHMIQPLMHSLGKQREMPFFLDR